MMNKTTLLALAAASTIASAAWAADPAPVTTVAPSTTIAATVIHRENTGDHLSSKIVGADVYSTTGELIGDVNDLIIDRGGKVAGIVVGVGGFLGVGEKNVALAYESMQMGVDDKGDPRLSVQVSKDELKNAVPFVTAEDS